MAKAKKKTVTKTAKKETVTKKTKPVKKTGAIWLHEFEDIVRSSLELNINSKSIKGTINLESYPVDDIKGFQQGIKDSDFVELLTESLSRSLIDKAIAKALKKSNILDKLPVAVVYSDAETIEAVRKGLFTLFERAGGGGVKYLSKAKVKALTDEEIMKYINEYGAA